MQIGRFFSLQKGRVGQYLSPRVLVVRKPFRALSETCYFGFENLHQAERFIPHLAKSGYGYQLRRSQVMPQPYEIRLQGHGDLAKTLAYWDRLDQRQSGDAPKIAKRQLDQVSSPIAA